MSTDLPGADPGGLAVVDLNGDGWLDVAVTDSRQGNLLTLFGTGTGGFANPVPWATGGSPRAVSAGSFNSDGTVDLAVVDAAFHRVVILLGNGNGGFFSAEAFPSGERPVAVASADLDRDGRVDLVVANAWSRTVSVFGGLGNGGFAPRVDTSVRFAPSSIVVEDWNGDGNLDVGAAIFVASNSVDADNTSAVAVLHNVAGSLSTPVYVRVGRHPASIVSADVNGDQRPDLITANGSSDDVSILLNACKRLLPPLLRRK
jgi:hypothetical protein